VQDALVRQVQRVAGAGVDDIVASVLGQQSVIGGALLWSFRDASSNICL
jgi:hypothetical protein